MIFIFCCFCSMFLSAVAKTTQYKPEKQNIQGCGDQGDCIASSIDSLNYTECHELCGCDRAYFYNETADECQEDLKYREVLNKIMTETYNTQDVDDNLFEDIMAKKIRLEAEQSFNGILISAMLFGACASAIAITACVYCCRIEYTDRKLKKEVNELAQKLKRDGKLLKTNKTPLAPIAESCNIVVEDAGVFCV